MKKDLFEQLSEHLKPLGKEVEKVLAKRIGNPRLTKKDKINMKLKGYDLHSVVYLDGMFIFDIQIIDEEQVKTGRWGEKTIAKVLKSVDFIQGYFIDDWDGEMYVRFELDTDRTQQDYVNTYLQIDRFVDDLTISEQRELLNELI